MSSIKDIMDVDVEPLESQAYTRQKEAAEASQSSNAQSLQTLPSLVDDNNKKQEHYYKRRRSSRSPKRHFEPPTSRPRSVHRRSSLTGDEMDFPSRFQAIESDQATSSGSSQLPLGGSEPAQDLPVKYTPVTGRISRAKKGVPVHVCDICGPSKTFTRAEHLRRHKLSHQKPAFPCTFEDCERAFHRHDLLARHIHRHETQVENPYRPGDRSRSPSATSESLPPSLNVETPSQIVPLGSASQTSPSDDTITPRSSTTLETPLTATSFDSGMNYSALNYTTAPRALGSNERSGSDSEAYRVVSSESLHSRTGSYDLPPHAFNRPVQPTFGDYTPSDGPSGGIYNPTPQLPFLRIPDDTFLPGLSYTQDNSPWSPSASDSNYDTQSDGSRSAQHCISRNRSDSLTNMSEWPIAIAASQWPNHGLSTTPQDLRELGFDGGRDHDYSSYTGSPQMTPPVSSGRLLDVPLSYNGHFYNMDTVASSGQLISTELGVDRRTKELVDSPQLASSIMSPASPCPLFSQPQLEIYLQSYFRHFHVAFPIIHQPTFDASADLLLTNSLAALGTQYHGTPEDRATGSELNEACRKAIRLLKSSKSWLPSAEPEFFQFNWTLQTMQAILLTELFTRFRGRKTIIRISAHFEELYRRLLNSSACTQASTGEQLDLQNDWNHWINDEAWKRLLSACFIFDVHQSIYHQQPRSRWASDINDKIWLPCQASLWKASTSTEWRALLSETSIQSFHLVEQDISSIDVSTCHPFVRSLVVCSFATMLPKREIPNYPNDFIPSSMDESISNIMCIFPNSRLAHVCLALFHTPLHDLLAIAGDTWVFARKLTPPSAFHFAQSRLRKWSSSLSAAQATYHSCKILEMSLSRPFYLPSSGDLNSTPTLEEPESSSPFIWDYWSLYVPSLICWAFGNRYSASYTSVSGSGTISRSNSSSTLDIENLTADEIRTKALTYVNAMLELDVEQLITSKASMRGETSGVIDAVRQRLDAENVGNKSSLIVDAVDVLSKIRVATGKWF